MNDEHDKVEPCFKSTIIGMRAYMHGRISDFSFGIVAYEHDSRVYAARLQESQKLMNIDKGLAQISLHKEFMISRDKSLRFRLQ